MAEMPRNAEEYEAYKQSAEYLDEMMRCSVITNELRRIMAQMDRGMLSSQDVVHMLSRLVGEVEGDGTEV